MGSGSVANSLVSHWPGPMVVGWQGSTVVCMKPQDLDRGWRDIYHLSRHYAPRVARVDPSHPGTARLIRRATRELAALPLPVGRVPWPNDAGASELASNVEDCQHVVANHSETH